MASSNHIVIPGPHRISSDGTDAGNKWVSEEAEMGRIFFAVDLRSVIYTLMASNSLVMLRSGNSESIIHAKIQTQNESV